MFIASYLRNRFPNANVSLHQLQKIHDLYIIVKHELVTNQFSEGENPLPIANTCLPKLQLFFSEAWFPKSLQTQLNHLHILFLINNGFVLNEQL